MDGPRLAGSLIATAIGSFLLACLFAWAVYKRQRNLDQDIEATKISQRASYISTFRLLNDPPTDNDVYLAMGGLRLGLRNLAWHCAVKSKLSTQSISESRLQSCLTELSGGQYRLSPQSLLELLPSQVMAFVSHVVGTSMIGAIDPAANPRTSIMHSVLAPEVTANPDNDQDRRCVIALARHCVHTLYSAKPNKEGTDHLMKLLTVLMGETLGSAVVEQDEFQPELLTAFKAATKLGECLIHHPAEFRFDWMATNHQISDDYGMSFPRLYRVSDKHGMPVLRPMLIGSE